MVKASVAMRPALVVLFVLGATGRAHGVVPSRDKFLEPPKPGTYLSAAAFTIGAQLQLEHRRELEEGFSMVTGAATMTASQGFSEVAVGADARLLFLSVGATGGVRDVWRNYAFGPGQDASRDERRARDKAGDRTVAVWPFAEARARLSIPLDLFFWNTTATLRWEGGDGRAFDWFHANVHDAGLFGKVESTFLFRHPSIGAVGPWGRYMRLRDAGVLREEFSIGGQWLIAPWKKRDDIIAAQVLVTPGDSNFGFHVLGAPLYVMLAYRATFSVK
jgi:hypothetical protein